MTTLAIIAMDTERFSVSTETPFNAIAWDYAPAAIMCDGEDFWGLEEVMSLEEALELCDENILWEVLWGMGDDSIRVDLLAHDCEHGCCSPPEDFPEQIGIENWDWDDVRYLVDVEDVNIFDLRSLLFGDRKHLVHD